MGENTVAQKLHLCDDHSARRRWPPRNGISATRSRHGKVRRPRRPHTPAHLPPTQTSTSPTSRRCSTRRASSLSRTRRKAWSAGRLSLTAREVRPPIFYAVRLSEERRHACPRVQEDARRGETRRLQGSSQRQAFSLFPTSPHTSCHAPANSPPVPQPIKRRSTISPAVPSSRRAHF